MKQEIKRRLDGLNELLSEGYITEAEYAVARENIFLDAGFDIVPRSEVSVRQEWSSAPRRRRRRHGCGGFLALLLMVAVVAAFLLLSRIAASDRTILGAFLESESYRNACQAVMGFIDDLRGNPAPLIPDSVTSSSLIPSSDAFPAPADVPAVSADERMEDSEPEAPAI